MLNITILKILAVSTALMSVCIFIVYFIIAERSRLIYQFRMAYWVKWELMWRVYLQVLAGLALMWIGAILSGIGYVFTYVELWLGVAEMPLMVVEGLEKGSNAVNFSVIGSPGDGVLVEVKEETKSTDSKNGKLTTVENSESHSWNWFERIVVGAACGVVVYSISVFLGTPITVESADKTTKQMAAILLQGAELIKDTIANNSDGGSDSSPCATKSSLSDKGTTLPSTTTAGNEISTRGDENFTTSTTGAVDKILTQSTLAGSADPSKGGGVSINNTIPKRVDVEIQVNNVVDRCEELTTITTLISDAEAPSIIMADRKTSGESLAKEGNIASKISSNTVTLDLICEERREPTGGNIASELNSKVVNLDLVGEERKEPIRISDGSKSLSTNLGSGAIRELGEVSMSSESSRLNLVGDKARMASMGPESLSGKAEEDWIFNRLEETQQRQGELGFKWCLWVDKIELPGPGARRMDVVSMDDEAFAKKFPKVDLMSYDRKIQINREEMVLDQIDGLFHGLTARDALKTACENVRREGIYGCDELVPWITALPENIRSIPLGDGAGAVHYDINAINAGRYPEFFTDIVNREGVDDFSLGGGKREDFIIKIQEKAKSLSVKQ